MRGHVDTSGPLSTDRRRTGRRRAAPTSRSASKAWSCGRAGSAPRATSTARSPPCTRRSPSATPSGHDHRETAMLYNSLAIYPGQRQPSRGGARRLRRDGRHLWPTRHRRRPRRADHPRQQRHAGDAHRPSRRRGRCCCAARSSASARWPATRQRSRRRWATTERPGRHRSPVACDRHLVGRDRDRHALYAGAASPVTLQDRLFLGEAQLAAGDAAAARATLQPTLEDARSRYGDRHPLTLRTLLAPGPARSRRSDPRQRRRGSLLPSRRCARAVRWPKARSPRG